MSFKLQFIIDKDWDRERTFSLFCNPYPIGWINCARQTCVPLQIAEKIHNNHSDALSIWTKFIDEEYEVESRCQIIEPFRLKYQHYWDKTGAEFASSINHITNVPLDSYTCVLGFHASTSNWQGTKFLFHFLKPDYYQEQHMIGFEVLLSHVFKIVRLLHSREEMSDWCVWGLAEITSSFLIREIEVRKLFASEHVKKLEENWFGRGNYDVLVPFEERFRDIYLAKNDFGDYLEKCLMYFKTVPIEIR